LPSTLGSFRIARSLAPDVLAVLDVAVRSDHTRPSGSFHRGCQNILHHDDGTIFERKRNNETNSCSSTYSSVISGSTMKKYNLETAGSESVGEEAVDDGSWRAAETYPEMHEEAFVDCLVCHYWSERLETTRAHPLSTLGAFGEEKRLIAVLKGHQSHGACARRLPHVLDMLLDSR